MKNRKDGYFCDMGKSKRENMAKLKELIIELGQSDSELKKAITIIRTYSSYPLFLKAFYYNGNVKEDFADFKDQIIGIGKLYKKYEEIGLIDVARNENNFLIKNEGDLDSRYIIEAYIHDFYSYDIDKFYSRYKINRRSFENCVNRVKLNDKDLYEEYLKVVEDNKTKRLVMPIYSINSIIEGIQTGKTIDGKNFDVFEFYKIAPFLDKDFDNEVRILLKDFPKLEKYKQLKRDLRNSDEHKSGVKLCNYADNLYLFTKTFSNSQAEVLKTWMEENNVSTLTPIYRASTVNCYSELDTDFNRSDADSIFDAIEAAGYPKTREVFELLKQDKINKKKIAKLNLVFDGE